MKLDQDALKNLNDEEKSILFTSLLLEYGYVIKDIKSYDELTNYEKIIMDKNLFDRITKQDEE